VEVIDTRSNKNIVIQCLDGETERIENCDILW